MYMNINQQTTESKQQKVNNRQSKKQPIKESNNRH